MAKKVKSETPSRIKLYTRDHDDQSYRVWREGWDGDQFEVIGKAAFSTFAIIAQDRLSIVSIEHKVGDEE